MDPLEYYRDHTGAVRVLGTLEAPPSLIVPTKYSAPTLPESAWLEFTMPTPAPVLNQGGFGACVGHAAATSLEVARFVQGQPHLDLSPWYIYAHLCNGIDRGASISEALTFLQRNGTSTFAAVPYGTINPRRIPEAATAEAPRFHVEIGSALANFGELMTATQLRRPGNFSIRVGPGFDNLDADGCPRPARGAGNHAVTFGLGAKKAKDGRWLIKCQNSWSAKWGLSGFFWLGPEHLERQSYFEAYSVECPSEDPADTDTPPIAA
jgi:hypothetical protein